MNNFRTLRNLLIKAGFISPKCRELTPYYYSSNQARGCKERKPGHVALWVKAEHRRIFGESDYNDRPYPYESWCGNYPKTKRAIEAENEGLMRYDSMLSDLIEFGRIETLRNEGKYPREVGLMSPGFQCGEAYIKQGDFNLACYPFFLGWMLAKGIESGHDREWDAFRDYLLAYHE